MVAARHTIIASVDVLEQHIDRATQLAVFRDLGNVQGNESFEMTIDLMLMEIERRAGQETPNGQ